MLKSISSLAVWLCMWLPSPSSWAKVHCWPTGIQVSMDISRPLYCIQQKMGMHHEFNGVIDFTRLMLEGDYGWGYIQRQGVNKETKVWSNFTSYSKYLRIGLNVNLLKDCVEKNRAFLGIRYARSFLQYQLRSTVSHKLDYLLNSFHWDRFWPDRPVDITQANVQAGWFELVGGGKVKVWALLYIGATVRYKFNKHLRRNKNHSLPFEILGWGLNEHTACLGANFYLSLRIPLQKTMHSPGLQKKPRTSSWKLK